MRVFIARMGAHKYVLAHQVYACAVTSVRDGRIYAFYYHQCVWRRINMFILTKSTLALRPVFAMNAFMLGGTAVV